MNLSEWWILLPALLVILTAILTKRTAEPLLLGVIVTYILTDGVHFLPRLIDSLFSVLTDRDTVWLLISCGLFGSLIALLNACGGTQAIAEALSRVCRNQRATLLSSWLLGILIFVDDYMNIMTISSCMKRLSDKQGMPREALAYVIDSTGAPACVLVPFSTWAIFYSATFLDCTEVKALGCTGITDLYVRIIPFMFYAMFALLLVPMFANAWLPKWGAMKRAYAEAKPMEESRETDTPASKSPGKAGIWDFILPIGVLMVVTTVTSDIFIALLASLVLCLLLYVPRKILRLKTAFDKIMEGFADMIPSLWIIAIALLMKQAQTDLHLPEFVVGNTLPYLVKPIFPAAVFVIVAGLAFVTGSNWGIPAMCAPIAIPLAAAANVNLYVVMAAIVSAGTFSSHACFYSDATVLTSSCCDIDNLRHAESQLPYALLAFGLSAAAYTIVGIIL